MEKLSKSLDVLRGRTLCIMLAELPKEDLEALALLCVYALHRGASAAIPGSAAVVGTLVGLAGAADHEFIERMSAPEITG